LNRLLPKIFIFILDYAIQSGSIEEIKLEFQKSLPWIDACELRQTMRLGPANLNLLVNMTQTFVHASSMEDCLELLEDSSTT